MKKERNWVSVKPEYYARKKEEFDKEKELFQLYLRERKPKDTGEFVRDCLLFSGSRSSKLIGALTWITIGLMFALLGYIFAAVQCSQFDKI